MLTGTIPRADTTVRGQTTTATSIKQTLKKMSGKVEMCYQQEALIPFLSPRETKETKLRKDTEDLSKISRNFGAGESPSDSASPSGVHPADGLVRVPSDTCRALSHGVRHGKTLAMVINDSASTQRCVVLHQTK